MQKNELVDFSTKEGLWHQLREDLSRYFPETNSNNLLMCPACARFFPPEDFSLEHIIPRQAIRDDPFEIKDNSETTSSVRSGLTLLCTKPLLISGKLLHGNGCNSWKGKYYDRYIKDFLNGSAVRNKGLLREQHSVALMCAAYLAMVREYGYQIALTKSGVALRRQFFSPLKFRKDIPMNCQIVLSAPPPKYSEEHLDIWRRPFKFSFEREACLVIVRTVAIRLPMSRDPRTPIANFLTIAPSKFKMRPDFRTALE